MNPQQILDALAEVFASCSTYRDSGQVKTRFQYPNGRKRHTTVRPFNTSFVRPDHFRFEYRQRYEVEDEWDRYIVWAHRDEVRTWWDIRPGVSRPDTLRMALAGATGVSGGSAHTVPALLLPDQVGVNSWNLHELADLVSHGDVSLDEVTCYQLSGRFPDVQLDPDEEEQRAQEVLALTGRRPEKAVRSPITIWIDRGTLLIRRIEEVVRFETFWTETVTDYTPAIGVSLTDEELAFGLPENANSDAAADVTGS